MPRKSISCTSVYAHGAKTVNARPLTRDQVPDYIATYAPEDRRAWVSQQIAPLITDKGPVSPLFLRFAIEQAVWCAARN